MTAVFLVGGAGFIGKEALKALSASPDVAIEALVRSDDAAREVAKFGAAPLLGDLERDGPWRDAAARADVVVHAAQPATFGRRLTDKAGRDYETRRLAMDGALFRALQSGRTKRIVYVSGNSFYGETGAGAPLDETMDPRPTGFGPYIRAAVALAEGQSDRGRETIIAFPGAVYGPGSWLKQFFIDPISAGRPVMQVSGPPKWASPVAVSDCGRAIAHLALLPSDRLESRSARFFIVDDRPATYDEIAEAVGRALGKAVRIRRVPGFVLQLFAGKIVRSYMETNSKYRNDKLRSTGFALQYPTIDSGIPALMRG